MQRQGYAVAAPTSPNSGTASSTGTPTAPSPFQAAYQQWQNRRGGWNCVAFALPAKKKYAKHPDDDDGGGNSSGSTDPILPRRWIVDTGASYHVVNTSSGDTQQRSAAPVEIMTASGPEILDSEADVQLGSLGTNV